MGPIAAHVWVMTTATCVCLAGCDLGSIHSPSVGAGMASGGTTAGSTILGGSTGGPAGTSSDTPTDPGHPLVHRLTQLQYLNSARDLLSVDPNAIAVSLPSDPYQNGFNDLEESLQLGTLAAQQYGDAAQAFVTAALSDPATQARLAPCAGPITANCVGSAVLVFAGRAWHRPLTTDEGSRLQTFVAMQSDPNAALSLGLQAVLTAPQFLMRLESSANATTTERISDYDLAARLSYFLWASVPDVALLDAAAAGQLSDQNHLAEQVDRMLDDPKAGVLATDFAAQWLQFFKIDSLQVNDSNFTPSVRQALRQQAQAVYAAALQRNAPITDLLSNQNSFLNDTLANFYGLAPVHSVSLVAVRMPAERQGILGLAGTLAGGSHLTSTSPVRRGVWVLNNLLCFSIPPPPAEVPALPALGNGTTERQLLEQHVSNASCASCHNLIDPIGLALQKFDFVGQSRTTDSSGAQIDTAVTMSDGTAINGSVQLAGYIAQSAKYPPCAASQLTTYALGRVLSTSDHLYVNQIVSAWANQGYGMRDLVHQIVSSNLFTLRSPTGDLP